MATEQLAQSPFNYSIGEVWNCDPDRIDDYHAIHELATRFIPGKEQLLVHPFDPIGKTFIMIDEHGGYAGGHFWPEYGYGLVVRADTQADPGIMAGANPELGLAMHATLKPGKVGTQRPPNIRHVLARTLIREDAKLLDPDYLLTRVQDLTDASKLSRIGGISYATTVNGEPFVVASEGLESSHFTAVLRPAKRGIIVDSDIQTIPRVRFSTNGSHPEVRCVVGHYQEESIPGKYELIIDALTCEKSGLGWNPRIAMEMFGIEPKRNKQPRYPEHFEADIRELVMFEDGSEMLARQIYL